MHHELGKRGSETASRLRELRRDVALDVSVGLADGPRYHAVVTDISKEGCQLRTEAPFETGDQIVLKHDVLGTLEAEVRWACAGRVGLQFTRAL